MSGRERRRAKMASRRVAIGTSTTEHLSVRADLAPLCNQHSTDWSYFEVRKPSMPLCSNCAGVLRRLTVLAAPDA